MPKIMPASGGRPKKQCLRLTKLAPKVDNCLHTDNLRATYAEGDADFSKVSTHGQGRRLINPKVAILQDFFEKVLTESL